MAVQNPYQSYQQNSVNTASPGELTLMLYNGCLKFVHQAKKAIEDKNIEARNINIQKASKIITELMVTLNQELEITKQILPLYDFMNRRLIEANLKNDLTALSEVEDLLVDFRDTWKQVIQLNRQKQFAKGGQA